MSAPSPQPAERHTIGHRVLQSLGRMGRLLTALAVVVLSLLTFPAAIPWMMAAWLGWHTWAAILLVKRVVWMPGTVAIVGVMLAAACLGASLARRPARRWVRRTVWTAVVVAWATWVVMLADWHAAIRCSRRVPLDPARPVVCLGDSLTAGVTPHGSYTGDLARLVPVPVVNLGQDGITSADALEKLPAVLAANPQVVVVEIGGHDFLKGHGRAATGANLERMIEACRAAGAEVVLMEIPRGLITDPFWGLERGLARRYDLELVSDTAIRKLVLWSPYGPPGMWLNPGSRLSDDGLHANARGNRLLAEQVARALARLLGPEVVTERSRGRSLQ
jgi:acyl-CoA thioesterase-1